MRIFPWFFFALVIGIMSYTFIFSRNDTEAFSKPLSQHVSTVNLWFQHEVLQRESLEDVVNNSLKGTTGTYSVVVKNLQTGEAYIKDEHKIYDSASLYKSWVMAVVFQQFEDGKLQQNEMLEEDVATLNEIFNITLESAEMTEGEISETTMQAVTQMITVSHNYSALLLTNRVGTGAVSAFLKQYSFSDSSFGSATIGPRTSASDMASFFEKLYNGEIVSKTASDGMLSILKKQQLNGGLPKYLPKGTVVAHKTGELGWVKHDAGIVFTPKGDYIILILSTSTNPAGAQERIALVSKAVYAYFVE